MSAAGGRRPVRVGVIGAGIMGADHINTLHRHVGGAAVTMVADVDLGRARDVAAVVERADPPGGAPDERVDP